MSRFSVGIVAIACFAGAHAVQAGTLLTIRENDDVLQSIDTNTLEFTDIGPLGVPFAFGGMAWDSSTGTLYMVDGRGARSLYTVDPDTGAATRVGPHGVQDLFGIAHDSRNDVLYGVTFINGRPLYTIDRSDGSATAGPTLQTRLGNLTYNSRDDLLLGVSDGAGDLYSIDRQTGEQTLILDGDFTNNSGLAYDPEQQVLWQIDWSGKLFKYDIDNNYARTLVLEGLGSHDGLVFLGGGGRCNYTIKKSKPKRGCDACPQRGDTFPTEASCEDVKDCVKKVKTTIACPQGPGKCKIKGKRSSCQ